jgi:hypothetical protein
VKVYAQYGSFSVGSEGLKLSYHNGMAFTAKDSDNDVVYLIAVIVPLIGLGLGGIKFVKYLGDVLDQRGVGYVILDIYSPSRILSYEVKIKSF